MSELQIIAIYLLGLAQGIVFGWAMWREPRLKASMSKKDIDDIALDFQRYGTRSKIVYQRAWHNPMRWIKGKYHQERIDPYFVRTNPAQWTIKNFEESEQ